jgi:hypothetical protein
MQNWRWSYQISFLLDWRTYLFPVKIESGLCLKRYNISTISDFAGNITKLIDKYEEE